MKCQFCESTRLVLRHKQVVNKRSHRFGNFDLYECKECGSLTTFPLPTLQALREFYSSSDFGIDERLRDLRRNDPQKEWYEKLLRQIKLRLNLTVNSKFSWLEFGPGKGELATLLSEEFPQSRGICVDFHDAPDGWGKTRRNVEWIKRDINEDFSLDDKFDLIFSISVIEHVIGIRTFFNNLRNNANNNSHVFLVAPDQGSVMSRMLGRSWPYFLPGEHLHIPTKIGLYKAALLAGFEPLDNKIQIHSITIPYSVRYVAGFLNMPFYERIPSKLTFAVPSGALALWGRYG